MRGKDYLVVESGTLSITAQGNSMISDNEEVATRGYISITGGVIQVTAQGGTISAISAGNDQGTTIQISFPPSASPDQG